MLYINNINTEYFNKKIDFVICDFDRTISTYESDTSWDLFRKSQLVSDNYKNSSHELFKLYRPIELSGEIPIDIKRKYMEDWALLQFDLMRQYIDYDLYNEIIKNNVIELRRDFEEFTKLLSTYNIPLYIVSGGLYDPILYNLKRNNCLTDITHIISNEVVSINNKITGITRPVIHSQNKKEINLNIDSEQLGLLFGDLPSDTDIGYGLNTINCGFMASENMELYKKAFDIVLTGDTSFTSVSKLFIKK